MTTPERIAQLEIEAADRARAAERERCAKIAEEETETPATPDSAYDRGWCSACDSIAAKIRSGE